MCETIQRPQWGRLLDFLLVKRCCSVGPWLVFTEFCILFSITNLSYL